MRYELKNGYISKVFFGCHSGTCTLYKGTIPAGYSSLEEWANKANIRAYKIVSGNLVFDEGEDARLQEEYNKGAWKDLTPTNGTWDFLQYKKDGNHVLIRGHATSFNYSLEKICTLPDEIIPSVTKYAYCFVQGGRIGRVYVNTSGVLGKNWAYTLSTGTTEEYTGTGWLQIRIEYETA